MKTKHLQQKSQKNLFNYIEDLKRWQHNQYIPGAYLGGDIHLMFRMKSKAGGLFLLISSVIPMALSIRSIILLVKSRGYEIANNLAGLIFLLTITILEVFVGWKFFKNAKRE